MFNELLHNPPIVLHEIACCDCLKGRDFSEISLANMKYTNELFRKFAKKRSNIFSFDVRTLPQYVPETMGNGLFKSDMIHFTTEVNREIARKILENYVK